MKYKIEINLRKRSPEMKNWGRQVLSKKLRNLILELPADKNGSSTEDNIVILYRATNFCIIN